jgi:hypothetical protein
MKSTLKVDVNCSLSKKSLFYYWKQHLSRGSSVNNLQLFQTSHPPGGIHVKSKHRCSTKARWRTTGNNNRHLACLPNKQTSACYSAKALPSSVQLDHINRSRTALTFQLFDTISTATQLILVRSVRLFWRPVFVLNDVVDLEPFTGRKVRIYCSDHAPEQANRG